MNREGTITSIHEYAYEYFLGNCPFLTLVFPLMNDKRIREYNHEYLMNCPFSILVFPL